MTRHVTHKKAEKLVALREDHPKVASNRTRWAVVGLDGDVVPNQTARRE